MAKGGALRKYKAVIESLGLRQLDVYRIKEGSREVDKIRVKDMTTGKVLTINLGTVREALSYSEFLKRVLDELQKNGISPSERIISKVSEAVRELDKRYKFEEAST
jgi:hypothetical protein